MIFEHNFKGRKPTPGQVRKVAAASLARGYQAVEITWGEHMIGLEVLSNGLIDGYGWIRGISGYDLAVELREAA